MNREKILDLLEERKYKELKEELDKFYPVDIAQFLEDEADEKQMLILFRLLPKEEAAETFAYMNSDTRETLINALTDSELEEVMDEMYLDDTVDVLEEMPANVVDRLLLVTDEDTRKQINQLLQYPEDSAGSVMNVDYVGLRPDMTVEEAILKIRQVGINRETIYTCYVREKKKLVGVVDVKDLLTSSDSKTMEEIMETNVIYAKTTDDQEDVAHKIIKYGLVAIPIVDHEMCMVGIVTVDDAMLVLQDEATEDISIMAGVSPAEETYFSTSVFQEAKNRSVWLLFLMLSATFSGMVLDHFSYAVLAMPVLNAFVPMLTGTGGNCGSQSSTLVIRGITVGEIQLKNIFRVIFKEVRVALLVGLILAVVNGVRVVIMYQGKTDNPLLLAFALGITLMCTIVMAKTIGCTLPLLAKRIGLDPAIMAAPLITTLVDTGTTLIYFSIVTRVFRITA
ncbi:MAG TPA: magnesium transporter [Candidatus Bariatricus faecipullorum]|nr:magnesium transporter [Candidatus Bariatricus faecipullorum]